MRINGRWLPWADGVVRPTITVWVTAQDGGWRQIDFLVDTGADRTAFTFDLLTDLGLPSTPFGVVSGVGGAVSSVTVATAVRLRRDDGGTFTINSQFLGFTTHAALEMNVLGRDILNLFAVIVDRPGSVVCLLAPGHQYAVVV